ncbi:MAG: PKD domain-containing protein [Bacteroidota bacterium]
MSKRFTLASLFVSACALLLFVGNVDAQEYRGDTSVYLKARVGVNSYIGDRLTDVNDERNIGDIVNYMGPAGGLELGIHLSPQFQLGLFHLSGRYERTNESVPIDAAAVYGDNRANVFNDPNDSNDGEWKHSLGLVGRYYFNDNQFAPYVQGFLGYTFGRFFTAQDVSTTNGGLMGLLGIGFDYALSDNMGLFLELDAAPVFNSETMDGVDADQGLETNVYVLGGLRFQLGSKCKAVMISSVSATTSAITAGESVTFTAVTNDMDATDPTTYTWDFGDGNTGMGTTVTHTYTQPGTYTASFSATNCGGTVTETVAPAITVAEAPFIELISIAANPMNPEMGQTVNFTSNFRGTQPVTCLWEFGDGSTSTDCNPSHTYAQPGTYTAKLTITNEAGSRSRELTITVSPPPVECIVDLNSVFFARNSSVLEPDALGRLRENVQLINVNPNQTVRIEGMASAGERRPQQLSEDRARAVEQFYIDNGIVPTRLMTVGMGRVGMGSKKEGTAQFRRVDSIPMDCNN